MGRVQPERASVPHVQLQACHPRPAAAIGRAARTATFDGMWLRTDASAANTIVSVPASSANNCEGPDSSAHAPAYDEPMPPTRPIATAVPTPVARIPAGYTCAARAYIVVCTALISPPVHASIASTATVDCASIGTLASSTHPRMAPVVIVSIVTRDPTRAMTSAPPIAPTTPPRLNAMSP